MLVKLTKRLEIMQAFRSYSFSLLWFGQTISIVGNGMFTIALAWQVLLLTDSGAKMSVVVIAQWAPTLIFLSVGGIVADRFPKQRIMLWSDVARVIVVCLVALLGFLGIWQFWHLVVLAFIFGVAQGFFIPAYQSILPEIVEKDYLRSANILSRLSHQVFDLFGPALGGLCIALVGPAGAFALDGVTFIVSIVTLFLMPIASTIKREEKEEEKKPVLFRSHIELFFRDFRAGVSYIATIKWLWISIIVSAFVNVGLEAPIEVALPKLVHDVWGGQVWLLGAILTAYAVGSIIAMIILGQLRDIPHRGWIGYLAFLFACLAIICFGLPLPKQIAPLVAIIANGCIGFGTSIFAVIWATLLQERVSSDKLGRVTSLDWIGSFGLMPLGFLAAGLITDTIGASWTFVMGGLLGVIFILAAFFVRDIRLLQ